MKIRRLEVRCCCDIKIIFGTLLVDVDKKYNLLEVGGKEVILELESWGSSKRLAVKSNDKSIDFFKQFDSFKENDFIADYSDILAYPKE